MSCERNALFELSIYLRVRVGKDRKVLYEMQWIECNIENWEK